MAVVVEVAVAADIAAVVAVAVVVFNRSINLHFEILGEEPCQALLVPLKLARRLL